MPVYRITVKLYGKEKTEAFRFFDEELDIVYAIIRKRVRVQYGHDNIDVFDLVMISSHCQEHARVMYDMQTPAYKRKQQITSVFKLPKLPEGKVREMYKK